MSDRRAFIRSAAALALANSLPAQAVEPLRMAYLDNFSPLSFREDGVLRGILIDLIDEVIQRRLEVAVEHAGYPWARAQMLVERGEHDGLCTIVTPARLAYAAASEEAVVTVPTYIFARADNPLLPKLQGVRTIDELRRLNPTVLSYNGNGWAKVNLVNFNVIWEMDYFSAQRMLVASPSHIMVENSLTMQHSLKRIPGHTEIRMTSADLDRVKFQLLINRRSAHVSLLPAFDKAMRQFKLSADYAKIFNRYGVQI